VYGTQREVRELDKKLTVNIKQGILGKLNPLCESLVESKKNVRNIEEIVNILTTELGVQYEVTPEVLNIARSENTPEIRIQSLAMALTQLATEAIIKNGLYKDIPEKELAGKLKVITQRWSEDIVTKIRTLPELRRKKLLSDRKCRHKNYITNCPVCGATGNDIAKDFDKLSAKCKKCGWTRTFDGSGKRTIPRKKKAEKAKQKVKPKAEHKAKAEKTPKVEKDSVKEEIKASKE